MEPLSPRLRRGTLILFIFLWIVLIPIIILYADGWRYTSEFGLVQTGGIYVWAPYSDAGVAVGGKSIGTSSFLNHGLYVNNLAPSQYTVTVEKEGFRPWKRTLIVEPLVVTDTRAFLIPKKLEFTRLTSATSSSARAYASTQTLDAYKAVFATPSVASSTVPTDASDSIGLFIVKGALIARWTSTEYPPSLFCERPSRCVKEFTVDGATSVTRAMFYKGGVVYRTATGEIYLSELDVRPTPGLVRIYAHTGADVSLINGDLIIKDGATFYRFESL
jgi:hypothetical protein